MLGSNPLDLVIFTTLLGAYHCVWISGYVAAEGSCAVPAFQQPLCLLLIDMQVANAVTVYVRRPGNPKKWRAAVTCMGKQSDLALLTVVEDAFWGDDLRPLVFLKEVPELQVCGR